MGEKAPRTILFQKKRDYVSCCRPIYNHATLMPLKDSKSRKDKFQTPNDHQEDRRFQNRKPSQTDRNCQHPKQIIPPRPGGCPYEQAQKIHTELKEKFKENKTPKDQDKNVRNQCKETTAKKSTKDACSSLYICQKEQLNPIRPLKDNILSSEIFKSACKYDERVSCHCKEPRERVKDRYRGACEEEIKEDREGCYGKKEGSWDERSMETDHLQDCLKKQFNIKNINHLGDTCYVEKVPFYATNITCFSRPDRCCEPPHPFNSSRPYSKGKSSSLDMIKRKRPKETLWKPSHLRQDSSQECRDFGAEVDTLCDPCKKFRPKMPCRKLDREKVDYPCKKTADSKRSKSSEVFEKFLHMKIHSQNRCSNKKPSNTTRTNDRKTYNSRVREDKQDDMEAKFSNRCACLNDGIFKTKMSAYIDNCCQICPELQSVPKERFICRRLKSCDINSKNICEDVSMTDVDTSGDICVKFSPSEIKVSRKDFKKKDYSCEKINKKNTKKSSCRKLDRMKVDCLYKKNTDSNICKNVKDFEKKDDMKKNTCKNCPNKRPTEKTKISDRKTLQNREEQNYMKQEFSNRKCDCLKSGLLKNKMTAYIDNCCKNCPELQNIPKERFVCRRLKSFCRDCPDKCFPKNADTPLKKKCKKSKYGNEYYANVGTTESVITSYTIKNELEKENITCCGNKKSPSKSRHSHKSNHNFKAARQKSSASDLETHMKQLDMLNKEESSLVRRLQNIEKNQIAPEDKVKTFPRKPNNMKEPSCPSEYFDPLIDIGESDKNFKTEQEVKAKKIFSTNKEASGNVIISDINATIPDIKVMLPVIKAIISDTNSKIPDTNPTIPGINPNTSGDKDVKKSSTSNNKLLRRSKEKNKSFIMEKVYTDLSTKDEQLEEMKEELGKPKKSEVLIASQILSERKSKFGEDLKKEEGTPNVKSQSKMKTFNKIEAKASLMHSTPTETTNAQNNNSEVVEVGRLYQDEKIENKLKGVKKKNLKERSRNKSQNAKELRSLSKSSRRMNKSKIDLMRAVVKHVRSETLDGMDVNNKEAIQKLIDLGKEKNRSERRNESRLKETLVDSYVLNCKMESNRYRREDKGGKERGDKNNCCLESSHRKNSAAENDLEELCMDQLNLSSSKNRKSKTNGSQEKRQNSSKSILIKHRSERKNLRRKKSRVSFRDESETEEKENKKKSQKKDKEIKKIIGKNNSLEECVSQEITVKERKCKKKKKKKDVCSSGSSLFSLNSYLNK